MKQVAKNSSGEYAIYLDEHMTEDEDGNHHVLTSELVKVAGKDSYLAQVALDYEAMLLLRFEKYHDSNDPCEISHFGWSALPRLVSPGKTENLYVQDLTSKQQITGRLVPLTSFLLKASVDHRAATYMVYQVLSFYDLAYQIGYISDFYPNHWLVDPQNLRLVICDLTSLHYVSPYGQSTKIREHCPMLLEAICNVFLKAMAPHDEGFADGTSLLLDLKNGTASSRIGFDSVDWGSGHTYVRYHKVKACSSFEASRRYLSYKLSTYGFVRKNNEWSQCELELVNISRARDRDIDREFPYCEDSTSHFVKEVAILAEMAVGGAADFDVCTRYDVVTIGYGVTPPDLPIALAYMNGVSLVKSQELSIEDASSQEVIDTLYRFVDERRTWQDNQILMIWTDKAAPQALWHHKSAKTSLAELTAELNTSDRVYVFLTDYKVQDSWATFFGRRHVRIVDKNYLNRNATSFFRSNFDWKTLSERLKSDFVGTMPSYLQESLPEKCSHDDIRTQSKMLERWEQRKHAANFESHWLRYIWNWNINEKEGISNE